MYRGFNVSPDLVYEHQILVISTHECTVNQYRVRTAREKIKRNVKQNLPKQDSSVS